MTCHCWLFYISRLLFSVQTYCSVLCRAVFQVKWILFGMFFPQKVSKEKCLSKAYFLSLIGAVHLFFTPCRMTSFGGPYGLTLHDWQLPLTPALYLTGGSVDVVVLWGVSSHHAHNAASQRRCELAVVSRGSEGQRCQRRVITQA